MGVAYGARIVEVLSDKVLKNTDSKEKVVVKTIPKVQSNSFISKPGSLKHHN